MTCEINRPKRLDAKRAITTITRPNELITLLLNLPNTIPTRDIPMLPIEIRVILIPSVRDLLLRAHTFSHDLLNLLDVIFLTRSW